MGHELDWSFEQRAPCRQSSSSGSWTSGERALGGCAAEGAARREDLSTNSSCLARPPGARPRIGPAGRGAGQRVHADAGKRAARGSSDKRW